MTNKIIIEKIIIYVFILVLGILFSYVVHMRETGYTDFNGNYVKGTLEIQAENKQKYISKIEGYGFEYQSVADSYITFKKEATISSLVKIKADFSKNEITDCFFDIYFENSNDGGKILSVITDIAEEIDFEKEFDFTNQLEKFNSSKVTVTANGEVGVFELKPVDGFKGVVVSLRTEK